MKPKKIAEYGASRAKIRVTEQVVGNSRLVRVQWRQDGKRMTRSWPNNALNKKAAKLFAEGIADGRLKVAQDERDPITLRELWEKFAEAVFPTLRPKSQTLYRQFWNHWEIMWGKDFVVEKTTLDMVNTFRASLTKQNKALSSIRHSIETVKMVYAWGQLHELIQINKIQLYKFKVAKEDRTESPDEYTDAEFKAFIAELDPNHGAYWRAFVALTICRYQGARQNSVLHLKWSDIGDETITWRREWDKNGNEWEQPLREATREALAVARKWREKSGYEGPWVIPSNSAKAKTETYTIGALWRALKNAEKNAKLERKKGKGGHALRRLLAGDVWEATGDALLAMRAINDKDPRRIKEYLKDRESKLEGVFGKMDREGK